LRNYKEIGMNSYRRSSGFCAAIAAFLLLPAAGAWAQAGGAAPTKVAILNVRLAIASTAEGKQANVQLQAQFTPQTTDLDNMQRQIQDLQSRLTNGARTLSDDEKARLQNQGQLLQRQFQRKQDDLNDQLTAAQGDIVDEIGRKMLDVLDKYSKENGFAAVLDTSAQGTPVVYGAPQLDITNEIVRLYDQQYPMKAGAAAPTTTTKAPATPAAPRATAPAASAPAAPKPATPAPTK
jgi:outer membrane protein